MGCFGQLKPKKSTKSPNIEDEWFAGEENATIMFVLRKTTYTNGKKTVHYLIYMKKH